MKYLKTIVKRFFVFCGDLYQTLSFFVYLFLKTDARNHLPKFETEKQLIVMSGGPSLKKDINIINFSDKEISVVNEFYKSPWFSKLQPKFYVIADPLFFTKDERILSIVNDVDWDMMLLVPYSSINKIKHLISLLNKHITLVPYHSRVYKGFECLRFFLYRKGLSMPRAQNVLVASIFTGINMGFKEIHLYGVDHSWCQTLGVNSMNQVCAVDTHFYDQSEASFSPYWKNPDTKEEYKMHELLRDFAFMFESYHDLRKYTDYMGCRILNCTKNSFIDAFERA